MTNLKPAVEIAITFSELRPLSKDWQVLEDLPRHYGGENTKPIAANVAATLTMEGIDPRLYSGDRRLVKCERAGLRGQGGMWQEV